MTLQRNMAIIIKTTGETIEVKPKNGTDFQFDELKDIVGGYIEIIYLYNDKDEIMVMNEEGKFGCKFNSKATLLAKKYKAIHESDYVCGDVLVCKNNQVK